MLRILHFLNKESFSMSFEINSLFYGEIYEHKNKGILFKLCIKFLSICDYIKKQPKFD